MGEREEGGEEDGVLVTGPYAPEHFMASCSRRMSRGSLLRTAQQNMRACSFSSLICRCVLPYWRISSLVRSVISSSPERLRITMVLRKRWCRERQEGECGSLPDSCALGAQDDREQQDEEEEEDDSQHSDWGDSTGDGQTDMSN